MSEPNLSHEIILTRLCRPLLDRAHPIHQHFIFPIDDRLGSLYILLVSFLVQKHLGQNLLRTETFFFLFLLVIIFCFFLRQNFNFKQI